MRHLSSASQWLRSLKMLSNQSSKLADIVLNNPLITTQLRPFGSTGWRDQEFLGLNDLRDRPGATKQVKPGCTEVLLKAWRLHGSIALLLSPSSTLLMHTLHGCRVNALGEA